MIVYSYLFVFIRNRSKFVQKLTNLRIRANITNEVNLRSIHSKLFQILSHFKVLVKCQLMIDSNVNSFDSDLISCEP